VIDRCHLHFRVGAAKAEITPPLEVGLLMSAGERKWEPFEGVRSPLYARALVIEGTGRRIALVSLDLLGISGKAFGGRDRFKARGSARSKRAVRSSDLILTATHTHAAPETLAVTDLYRTPQFKRWVGMLAERVGQAVRRAAQGMNPCLLGIASAEVPGFAIHRRIKTTRGVVLSHPEPPPETVISREGAVDPTVNVAAFLGHSKEPVAVLVNGTCHPVHEMCIPRVSPDYPGEMCRECVGFVFIPGEPFVEIGLGIRQASPFEPTWVVSYAGDYVGYIPTDRAFDEGGYELGPGPWARVGPGSEGTIRREALALLRCLK